MNLIGRSTQIARIAIPVSFLFLLSTSCVNVKKSAYFGNIADTTVQSAISNLDPVVHPSDILSISISSSNPDASLVFNPTSVIPTSSSSTSASSQSSVYLVNSDGNIQIPLLGTIKAEGLSKSELKRLIARRLVEQRLLTDPVVTIRYLNFHVYVLGEVAHPGEVAVPSERINVFQAISLSGDLTIYGRRENVLLVREEGGQKVTRRLDLSSDAILKSPFYYLQSNDIIYVEPNKARVASSSRSLQVLPIVLSAVTAAALLLDRIIK